MRYSRASSRRRSRYIKLPASPELHNAPSREDKQLSPRVITRRLAQGWFVVFKVLRAESKRWHSITVGCPHCNRALTAVANGPGTLPKFARDEVSRLTVLEHLRTEHTGKIGSYKKEPPEESLPTELQEFLGVIKGLKAERDERP